MHSFIGATIEMGVYHAKCAKAHSLRFLLNVLKHVFVVAYEFIHRLACQPQFEIGRQSVSRSAGFKFELNEHETEKGLPIRKYQIPH